VDSLDLLEHLARQDPMETLVRLVQPASQEELVQREFLVHLVCLDRLVAQVRLEVPEHLAYLDLVA